jgi:predicted GIY-YIG superfamily endonuclease
MPEILVYAIRFEGGEVYVGMTDDLPRRLQEHERRQSSSTKRFRGSFSIIYQKSFPDYTSGRKHEKFLKSGAGRAILLGSVRAALIPVECRGFAT